MKTYSVKQADITRSWWLVDAEGIPLGRLAAEVAKILKGKNKPIYTTHLDVGDNVIVVNADKVALTGNKLQKKIYYRHSGYPGGLKEIPYEVLIKHFTSSYSAARAALLDAAGSLMLEEGYAAVTSRRVAARAELKPQLVHYYFRAMDDLFIEVFRRRAEQDLPRFEQAIAEDGSLRNLWRLNADPRGARFTIEFMALANHRKAIRAETPLSWEIRWAS